MAIITNKESKSNKIYKGIEWGNYWYSTTQWLKDIVEYEKELEEKGE